MTYEDALKELEKIATALEDKGTALEDAVKLFEKSLELSKFCFEKLKETDGKIVTLKKELDALIETPFDDIKAD